ncbi:type II toxin-antitoxin system VapC family toxin [Aciditerrimonas ferrireducens]|uniref:Type II toxin-antitoxin system VapC family toxin n=1 Tax=Aciditerrimonas ferrireducens TaxID=667306 RepID=A0ABV6C3I4_9ACTN
MDEDLWSRLEDEASRRGVSVGSLVREAIAQRFPRDRDRRRAALQAVLDAEPMDVPDPGNAVRRARAPAGRQRGMILLDTTVLVYASGTPHPLREAARGLLEMIRDDVVQATTSVEVIQEFTQVCARVAAGLMPRPEPGTTPLGFLRSSGPARTISNRA